jgi:hypothetical protein
MNENTKRLSRGELIELVRRICEAEGMEEEQDEMMELLEANVPHPEVSDLIFYPPSGVELSPEEIVDRALAYKPIVPPPSSEG